MLRSIAAFSIAALVAVVGSAIFFLAAGNAQTSSQGRVFRELKPAVVRPSASSVSRPVRDLAPAQPFDGNKSGKLGRAEQQARSVENKIPYRKQVENAVPDTPVPTAGEIPVPMPAPGVSFPGLSSNDNAAAYGFRIFPPDTIGAVGPSNYVQAVNALFRVYDKQGNPLTPPLKMSYVFEPLGTVCSLRNDGDPIVLYDQLADRWVLSQFCKAFPPFRQMIAVSKTGDPTGAYYIYEFVMPNVKQNDYPKLGVWSDAYYLTTDEFYGSDYAGSGVFAFDREKLLDGDPDAPYIYFDLASPSTMRLGGLLPADVDGLVPPPEGSPGLFLGYTATEYGDPRDALRIFEFSADFDDPSKSHFAEAAGSPLTVPPFDPTSNSGRADLPQPVPGEKLDSQSDRLMYRAAYFNYGNTESVIVNQTVRVSAPDETYRSGVRVHRIVRTAGGHFTVNDSSTIAAVSESRFMGAAAQDASGDMAVGYSIASDEKPPSIVYTGRLSSDPAGTFRPEASFVRGEGVQTAYGFRWGDYSGLSLDASDGCTFWITNEYYTLQSQQESPFGWVTRIGSFRFPECAETETGSVSGTISDASSGGPISGATLRIEGGYQRSSSTSGEYGPVLLPPGSYRLIAEANGYAPRTVDLDVASGIGSVVDIALDPIPVLATSGISFTKESCSLNGAAEPGESVTVELPLVNSGARDAKDLVATLSPSAEVLDPSPPQDYGSISKGAPAVSRSFSFTVGRFVPCGGEISLNFDLADGEMPLGTLAVRLNAGKSRFAFNEDFDASADLPAGWITSAEGGQSVWTITKDRPDSAPHSAFSPDPREVGLNELITPEIPIFSDQAELSFRNWYELETTFLRNRLYDGSVLEISIGGGKWQDILDAGGSFVEGGYDLGLIDSCCQNPLAGRKGWSGRSGKEQEPEYIDSRVKLPPSSSGNSVRFRWRVGTDIGTFRTGQYIDDVKVTDGFSCDCASRGHAPFDFDGDGRTDVSAYLPTDDPETPDFFIRPSSGGPDKSYFWGSPGDIAVNGDFDGEGIFDLAVYRPSERLWFILRSSDSTFRVVQFGAAEDIPVPDDYDGDSRTDIAMFRPSEGNWYFLNSPEGSYRVRKFGVSGDLPANGDYDGDGRSDVAVFRPSDGIWYVSASTEGFSAARFGLSGDVPVPGDYDGDGRSDLAVFRPSEGIWYLLRTSGGFYAAAFGLSGDQPLQADFDGDGRRDIALFRASGSGWYVLRSSDGVVFVDTFGSAGSTPVPGIYVR